MQTHRHSHSAYACSWTLSRSGLVFRVTKLEVYCWTSYLSPRQSFRYEISQMTPMTGNPIALIWRDKINPLKVGAFASCVFGEEKVRGVIKLTCWLWIGSVRFESPCQRICTQRFVPAALNYYFNVWHAPLVLLPHSVCVYYFVPDWRTVYIV